MNPRFREGDDRERGTVQYHNSMLAHAANPIMTAANALLRSTLIALAGVTAVAFACAAEPPRVPVGTNIDEAQVGAFTLPDPLVMANGERVRDAKTWVEKRRPEIIALFEHHQHGRTPRGSLQAHYDVFDKDTPAFGGKAKRTQVRIRFSNEPSSPTLRVLLYTPANAEGPVPTLLHLSFSPHVLVIDDPGIEAGFGWNSQTKQRVPGREARKIGSVYPETFLERGFGIALVYYGDIDPDFDGGAIHGVRALFGNVTAPRGPTQWGTIGAWSWGLSRILDYLQTNPRVDGQRVALSGVSRLGKAVLWAGALDERFALVMPLVSGEGGAALSRRNFGETVADLTSPQRYHYWYAKNYANYAQNVSALPVDGHLLIALIAPRPVLLITGSTDFWSDPKGEFLAAVAAEPVYELFGKRGLGTNEWPRAETPILHDIGYFMHDGPHEPMPHDYMIMAQFMAQHLGVRR